MQPSSEYETLMPNMLLSAADQATLTQGCHYNYVTQTWHTGHDHAHGRKDDCVGTTPLLFCGADAVTCAKSD
jgi:hypothetical protein